MKPFCYSFAPLPSVSYPAALFDPVAEPPVAEGYAAHIENKEGQDEEEDEPPS